MWIAVTRDLSPSLDACELTHIERRPIDMDRAREQHEAYRAALLSLGVSVVNLPALDEHPDAVFVEDAAIVLDEVAVATRPGAASRRGEVDSLAEVLAAWRPVLRIVAPATLDGGDVCRLGRTLFAGITSRTNSQGVAALAAAVGPHGYEVVGVRTPGCLHLKSALTALDDGAALAHRPSFDAATLTSRGIELLDVPADEAGGANVLAFDESALVPAAYPRTAELVSRHGLDVTVVDNGELLKAEAGLTCCSVLVRETDV